MPFNNFQSISSIAERIAQEMPSIAGIEVLLLTIRFVSRV